MDSELQKKVNESKLRISRIPSWAKKVFVARAEEEFDDDYGMCLASMVKECGEYNKIKQMFFANELNLKLLFDNSSAKNEEEEKTLTFGNGKKIKLKETKKHE